MWYRECQLQPCLGLMVGVRAGADAGTPPGSLLGTCFMSRTGPYPVRSEACLSRSTASCMRGAITALSVGGKMGEGRHRTPARAVLAHRVVETLCEQILRHKATNCAQTFLMAGPLSLRKSVHHTVTRDVTLRRWSLTQQAFEAADERNQDWVSQNPEHE